MRRSCLSWLRIPALLLALAAPASAGPGGRNVLGIVKSLEEGSITIATRGDTRRFALTPRTEYARAGGGTRASASELRVGAKIVVNLMPDKSRVRRILILGP